MRAAVVVLGDLGRSPRMQQHALALVANGIEVDLVGLAGAAVLPAVSAAAQITVHQLPDTRFVDRARGGRARYLLLASLRTSLHAARLLRTLLTIPRSDVLLVQTPPAGAVLAVAWLVSRVRRGRLVIDWHNLAHSVLAVRLGERHRAVRALRRSEKRWAGRADAHLCVSRALADWLQREWHVPAVTVYDRPAEVFAPASPTAVQALRDQLARDLSIAPITPLLVCPTSWTPDEDFDLLLEAVERADRVLAEQVASTTAAAAQLAGAPRVAVLLTGRGELRTSVEARLARRRFAHIAVRTAWLDAADYPTLIAAATAGLCLHQSSSGLDLPMKLAEFRGAGVPVCALDYSPVLVEVFRHGHEGATFRDPGQLSSMLIALASGEPAWPEDLRQARAWLGAHPAERWLPHWQATAAPVLLRQRA